MAPSHRSWTRLSGPASPTSVSSPVRSKESNAPAHTAEALIAVSSNLGRSSDALNEHIGGKFVGSLVLHAALIGSVFAWALFSHHGKSWGENSATTGAIQATMVASIPLPPRQPVNADNVLTSEKPSPAPPETKEKAAPVPDAKAVPIPEKPTKPTKVTEKPTPATPHPQPIKPQPDKATSGEAAGVRIAMSSQESKAGTVSIGTSDPAFGIRYAYYVRQLTAKIASQWYTSMLDPAANGHRVYIVFQVARDGTPSNVKIQQPSGDRSLDSTALRAVEHIDTFGPLPDGYAGSSINVVYYFDPPARP